MGLRELASQWYAVLSTLNAAVASPLRDLADAVNLPLLSALLFGLIGATSPCQLTTNAGALAYVARAGGPRRSVAVNALAYLLGKMLIYTLVGVAVILAGRQLAQASIPAIVTARKVLGPLMVLLGLYLLGLIPLRFSLGRGLLVRLLPDAVPALLRPDDPARAGLAAWRGLPGRLRPGHDAPAARVSRLPGCRSWGDEELPHRGTPAGCLAATNRGPRARAGRAERHARLLVPVRSPVPTRTTRNLTTDNENDLIEEEENVESVLSLAALLACPVGMGLMMWLMMRGGRHQQPGSTMAGPPAGEMTAEASPDDRLTRLRAQLGEVQAQQVAIAEQIARLSAEPNAEARIEPSPTAKRPAS